MLGILRAFFSLSPALVAGVSLFVGAGLALPGFMAWNAWVDNPQLQQRADDACTIRTQHAADSAEAAERARQRAISDAAADAYNAAVRAQEATRAGLQHTLEQERLDYAHELEAAGRACHLDSVDADWLRRQSDARDRGR
jgi:hypothetical protein